jgi:NADH-quinone oxidoreductase subunit E
VAQQTDISGIEPILEKHATSKSALITVLQEIQDVYGYVPEDAFTRLSREIKVPLSRVYGVVTFYSQFYLEPRGKNVIRICRGTACHVRGSSGITHTLGEHLGIEQGETTEDMQFTLDTVACLGTCFLAPVMMVNNDYHGKLDTKKAQDVVDEYAEPGE